MKPTTPLPPYSGPLFYCIEALIDYIWEESMKIEEEFYKTNSEALMEQFTMYVIKVQYWESVSLAMQREASK
jgi:hypothetical protein